MRNIIKSVLALALSLFFSANTFAQLHFSTIDAGKHYPQVMRGEEGVDYSKYAASEMPKAAGVNITLEGTTAITATIHYDKNDSTAAYYVLYGVPGLVEFYVEEYGYSHWKIFHDFYQEGAVSLFATDTTETIGGLFPQDSIVAYTLALATADDTFGVLSYQGITVRPAIGDAGRAEVVLTLSNITDNSCDVATEMNASTSCYYFAYGNADNYVAYSEDQIIYSIRTYLDATEENMNATLPNLEKDTTYTVFIVPYNAEGELGTYIARNFMAGGVSISMGNAVQFNVYPNPATSILNISGEEVQRVELYNAMGQCVMAAEPNGAVAQIDVNSLAKGAYILKVYNNDKVGTQKVMVK